MRRRSASTSSCSTGRGVNRDWARAGFIVGGPDRVAEQAQKLLDAGLDGLIFNMPHMEDPQAIALAGDTPAGLRPPVAARASPSLAEERLYSITDAAAEVGVS